MRLESPSLIRMYRLACGLDQTSLIVRLQSFDCHSWMSLSCQSYLLLADAVLLPSPQSVRPTASLFPTRVVLSYSSRLCFVRKPVAYPSLPARLICHPNNLSNIERSLAQYHKSSVCLAPQLHKCPPLSSSRASARRRNELYGP